MRFPPGTISVSPEADLPLLRTVHRAGHLTVHQLYSALHGVREKRLWDGLTWRVGRLVRHGLLDATAIAGLKSTALSLGDGGELYLQSQEQSLVERGRRTRTAKRRHQIWHDVEFFDVQLALRRAGVVANWIPECEIRAANDYTADRYAKDYDAVVTFQCNAAEVTLALEYERTPKSSAEYERICAEIALDRKVYDVLYLAPNRELKLFLLHAFRNTRSRIMVADARAFAQAPEYAPLIDVRSRHPYDLRSLPQQSRAS